MKTYFLAILLLTTNAIYSQRSHKEFEGIITYKTTIVLKDNESDIDQLYKIFGKERLYYFKAGKSKWAPKNVRSEYELFNPEISKTFVIDKFYSNDTLYYGNVSDVSDSITSVKPFKQMTILNIPCKSAIFTVTEETGLAEKYVKTIYYPVDTLTYTNSYFDNYKATGQRFISRYTNAIPLRMELDSKESPFLMIYEATNIEWKQLSDNEFSVDNKLPVKR